MRRFARDTRKIGVNFQFGFWKMSQHDKYSVGVVCGVMYIHIDVYICIDPIHRLGRQRRRQARTRQARVLAVLGDNRARVGNQNVRTITKRHLN